MKRLIACLLACLLLIPGMLVYASAEEEDSIFTYDDSKAYVPNVILMTFRYSFYSPDAIYPSNGWGSGAFGDVEPYIQNLKLVEDYEVVENGTRFTYRTYQLMLVEMYQHDELINLAAHLAEEVMSVDAVEFPHCVTPSSISLVEKPVIVEEYDGDNILDGYVIARIDLDYVAKDYPWSVEDFPELNISDARTNVNKTKVFLKLNDSSKEAMIDAAQKLAKRYEFTEVGYDRVISPDPIYPDSVDTTDDTTMPDDTIAPVTDVQTTAPATSAEETTASPNVEKPTSPPTGDVSRYAAIAFAAALVGAVGVVVCRRRRSA